MEEELGRKATVVATGGIAPKVIPHCRHEIVYDEDLLLKGLGIIYRKNTKK
jgi:type III pantothenate kinase